MIEGHHRRYFKEDLDKLSNEYLRAKTHLAKAIEVIELYLEKQIMEEILPYPQINIIERLSLQAFTQET